MRISSKALLIELFLSAATSSAFVPSGPAFQCNPKNHINHNSISSVSFGVNFPHRKPSITKMVNVPSTTEKKKIWPHLKTRIKQQRNQILNLNFSIGKSADVPKSEKKAASEGQLMTQRIQIWMIQNRGSLLGRTILPIISFVQGLLANNPTKLPILRKRFGPNFCVAGEVVLGDYETVSKALTSPQLRTYRLGTTILDANTLPMGQSKDRSVFMLQLSDGAAGGDGMHEAVRSAALAQCLNDESKARRMDETSIKLFEQLAKDYADMPHGPGEAFFNDLDRGLNLFFIKYIHYVMFGLDPENESNNKKFAQLYYASKVTLYWFRVGGKLANKLNLFGARDWPKMIDEVVEIYKDSPALSNFEEGQEQFKQLTKHELTHALVPLMGIAALIGPQHLAHSSMGNKPLPEYEDHEQLSEFDVTKVWDKLDLDNREELEKYLFECGRLWTPVSSTHRVADTEFTANIAGRDYKFPKGTVINIPILLGMLDEDVWGRSTYKFDHERKNLCPFSMIFNSVGDESAGRICPGKGLTLDMLTEVLKVTGKVRRS